LVVVVVAVVKVVVAVIVVVVELMVVVVRSGDGGGIGSAHLLVVPSAPLVAATVGDLYSRLGREGRGHVSVVRRAVRPTRAAAVLARARALVSTAAVARTSPDGRHPLSALTP
jgi:hypothetical protein